MKIVATLATIIILGLAGIAHAGATAETVFFLSDDLQSATSYYNSRVTGFGSPSFMFSKDFNHNLVMYARPENYRWEQEYERQEYREKLIFPDTNNYAFLKQETDPENFLIKKGENRYRLVIDGSECRGSGCTQDENIIAVVMPKKFKVTSYTASSGGNWKVVGNTYTCYTRYVQGNTLVIDFEDTIPYVYTELAKVLAQFNDIKVSYDGNNVKVAMPLEGIFAVGDAAIRKNAEKWLSVFTEALKKSKIKELRVEGHSDNVPIRKSHKSVYPSNWELSAARAASVVRYLVECGIDPKRLAAVGYADSRPSIANDTPAGRAKNRRIEFSIVPEAPQAEQI